jgi:hypothetical protein
MSVDKVTAKYWNGFITRTEAQKVFDEQGQVITHQAMAIQKLDAVLTYIAEKFGITHEDINNWMKAKNEAAQKAQADANKQANEQHDAAVAAATPDPTPSPIVLTD